MSQGKRAGARPKRQFRPALLLLALGITAAVVAWGYLVSAAIDFGTRARGGDGGAWAFLGLAALGAVMCLFLGLLLVARIGRVLGLGRGAGRNGATTTTTTTTTAAGPPGPPAGPPPGPPAPPAYPERPGEPGGHRAAR